MPIDETINHNGYAIVHQVVQPDQGDKQIHRYTVYRPNNGGKVGQTVTLPKAKKLVDDDIAAGGTP